MRCAISGPCTAARPVSGTPSGSDTSPTIHPFTNQGDAHTLEPPQGVTLPGPCLPEPDRPIDREGGDRFLVGGERQGLESAPVLLEAEPLLARGIPLPDHPAVVGRRNPLAVLAQRQA